MAGLLDWLDFNKSGGLDLGDVSTGISKAGTGLSNLWGSTGTVDEFGDRVGATGLLGSLMADKNMYATAGSLLGTVSDIRSAEKQADYLDFLKSQAIASTAREQQREEEAEEAMATGFQQSGLADYYGV